MAGFFNVGMTKSEVMAKIGSTQATERTKQFIQNFWNTDLDGKITNEIELAMLESWASGSERVKMPTKGAELRSSMSVTTDKWDYKEYISASATNNLLSIWTDISNGKPVRTEVEWRNGRDILFDADGDGYADDRKFKTYKGDVTITFNQNLFSDSE